MDSIPTRGTFVVFTFDPVASVANFENADLTAACEELAYVQKKYVAFVQKDRGELPLPYRQYNAFNFHPLWQGLDRLPSPMRCQGVQPNMLFPVSPNTYHPSSCLGHQPICINQPLPWKDCYISGLVRLEIRCEVERWVDVENDTAVPHQTTRDEALRVSAQISRDLTDVSGARMVIPTPIPSEAGSFDSDLSSVKAEERNVEKDNSVLDEGVIRDLCSCRDTEEKVIVKISTDLSTVDVVNHPDELYEQLATFERLIERLEHVRRRQDIETARRIDEDYFASVQYPEPQPYQSKASSHRAGRLLKYISKKLKKLAREGWNRRFRCRKETGCEINFD